MARRPQSETPKRPSDRALNVLQDIGAHEARGPFLPVRRSFLLRGSPDAARPPMVRLLPRAGLDAVQLKCFLLILRMAAYNAEHAAPYDSQVYATALDLPDPHPSGSGDKRARAAVLELEKKTLIISTRSPGGRRTAVRPLREDGSGDEYTNPAGRHFGERYAAEGHFFGLPNAFFTHGWIVALSAPAIATLLLLRHESETEGSWVYLNPNQRKQRHAMSNDTWQRGVRELQKHQLVVVRDRKTKSGPGPFDFERRQSIRFTAAGLQLDDAVPTRAYYEESR